MFVSLRAISLASLVLLVVWVTSCAPAEVPVPASDGVDPASVPLEKYTTVRLTTDLPLTDNERRVIGLLIDAAEQMESVFWKQAYGDRDMLLVSIEDADTRRFPCGSATSAHQGPTATSLR